MITGATRGLGKALALSDAKPGHHLVLIGRNLEALKEVSSQCESKGATTQCHKLDIRDHNALIKLILDEDDRAPIDIFIANAGVSGGNQKDQISEPVEAIATLVSVNFTAAILGIGALVNRFKARNSGHFVVIGSVMGEFAFPHSPTYCATKAGMKHYTESLRRWLYKTNIKVTYVYLGYVDTDMSRGLKTAKPLLVSAEHAAKKIWTGISLKSDTIWIPKPYWLFIKGLQLLPNWLINPIMKHTLIDVPLPKE